MSLSEPKEHVVLGMMSGTSCDGLDMACCRFHHDGTSWQYSILAAETIAYDEERRRMLSGLIRLSATDLLEAHSGLGRYFGKTASAFIRHHGLSPSIIASHGHTVFHQAEKGFTFQAGSGAAIAAVTGIDTVSDFRTLDVALGGQGAPLVPLGDKLLFTDHPVCLNLGGIANVSFDDETGQRIAFDICPVNMALNHLAAEAGMPYDQDGALARTGSVDERLLAQLDALPYYNLAPPKSLGFEWFETAFLPFLADASIPLANRLYTVGEHAAKQIGKVLDGRPSPILVTGGGALNTYLMERLTAHCKSEITVPSIELVQFKEAVVFAFLGLLRKHNGINTLSSVTGARADSSGGSLFAGSPQ